jgi:hypothetical protein
MTKHTSSLGDVQPIATAGRDGTVLPPQREGRDCDLYAPGHQLHYRHLADATHSPAFLVRDAVVDDSRVTLVLEDGRVLRWRHHDAERLERILELMPGASEAHPDAHALRVGPYWFNCATGPDDWQDCRAEAPRATS